MKGKKGFVWGIFVLNLAVILALWWRGSSMLLLGGAGSGVLIAFGRLTGLLAQYFILVELVLVSRALFIERVFGFDKLNKVHRTIGYTLAASIILHPLLLIYGYAGSGHVSAAAQTSEFLFHWEKVFNAFLALVIILLASVLSMPALRRKLKYETWHVTHLFMYMAIGLSFGHQVTTADVSYGFGLYYWCILNFFVFGLVVAYRFIRPFVLYYRHRFYVARVVKETHDVHSIYLKGRKIGGFNFEEGQYLSISFLTKGMWQPHPFSISSAKNGEYIRVSVKSSGDYTSKIGNIQSGTKAFIEGPLGKFTASIARNEKILFIAGGIGITPIRALAEVLSKKGREMVLLYGNKTPDDVVFKSELERMIDKIYYIFSVKGEGEKGYIDDEKITRLVPDFRERDVYLCGPPIMMESVAATLRKLGVDRCFIHYEKFSY
jgi:predicted ferric reductase